MGWDRRAVNPLKCTLPTAEESVDRSLDVFIRILLSSGAGYKTTLSQGVWKVSGTVRVNKHNCKDCPKTDGKQRPEWD